MPRRPTSTPRRTGLSAPMGADPFSVALLPLQNHRFPLHPPASRRCSNALVPTASTRQRDPDKMLAHLYQCHSKRLLVSAEIERAYGIPVKKICSGCRVLYSGVRRHLSAIKKPCLARDTALNLVASDQRLLVLVYSLALSALPSLAATAASSCTLRYSPRGPRW